MLKHSVSYARSRTKALVSKTVAWHSEVGGEVPDLEEQTKSKSKS